MCKPNKGLPGAYILRKKLISTQKLPVLIKTRKNSHAFGQKVTKPHKGAELAQNRGHRMPENPL